MRSLIAVLSSLALIGLASGEAVPRFLIVPFKKGTSPGPPLAIGNYVSQGLDQDGRVTPVVWSAADKIFRDAAYAGQLGSVPDFPSKQKAEMAAHALGATYVLYYSSQTMAKGIQARFELYQGKREIWNDQEDMGSKRSSLLNDEDTNQSIASTLVLKLFQLPLKSLRPRPKATTPAFNPGQEPIQVPVAPVVAPDSVPLVFEKVDELKKAGKIDQAIMMARDAIDSNPFDPKLRLLLIGLFEDEKNWNAAADAAMRASQVIPDNLDLRKASVRDLMAAGKTDLVQDQLNEMVARDPKSQNSLFVQAQTFLDVGDYGKAASSLNALVKSYPKPEAFFWRALCRATLGGLDGVNSDVQEYLKGPISGAGALHLTEESETIIQLATQKDIDLGVKTYRQVAISPNSIEVRDQLDQLERDASARAAFLQQIPSAPSLRESYGDLLLAQKLLLVSLVSIRDGMKTGSDDSMVDAQINLGEAIKSLKNSRRKLATEMGAAGTVELVVDIS